MRAVILAAGVGQRLQPLTLRRPKPLIHIFGEPMLKHVIRTLKGVGVEDCIIVTGYLGGLIREYVGDGSRFGVRVQYCHNPEFERGNAISLRAVRGMVGEEPFLLLMADHYLEEGIVREALKNVDREPLLCVDRDPHYPPQLHDATRVLVNPAGYIIDIGKNLKNWNAIDTGVFVLDQSIFPVIDLLERRKPLLTLAECIKYLSLHRRAVWACDVSNHLWFDIDTKEDIYFVEHFLRGVLRCQRAGME